MGNGLLISSDEFMRLPQEQQLKCLYENQVKTIDLMSNYRLHQKIQYPWLMILSGAAIFLTKQIVKVV